MSWFHLDYIIFVRTHQDHHFDEIRAWFLRNKVGQQLVPSWPLWSPFLYKMVVLKRLSPLHHLWICVCYNIASAMQIGESIFQWQLWYSAQPDLSLAVVKPGIITFEKDGSNQKLFVSRRSSTVNDDLSVKVFTSPSVILMLRLSNIEFTRPKPR